MIIGFGKSARVGKDTAAKILVNHRRFIQIGVADPARRAARDIFGFTQAQVAGSRKEVVDPYWGAAPREYLQRLVVCLMDEFGADVLTRSLRRYVNDHPGKNFVVSDLRRPIEADAIKAAGGFVVLIERPGAAAVGGVPGHVSETALDGYTGWDATIDNSGSLADLQVAVLELHHRLEGGLKP